MSTTSGERIARNVLDGLHEGCQVISFDFRYLYVNEAVTVQGQRSREELLGRTMSECYPGIERSPMFALLVQSMTERTHERMENEFDFPDGSKGVFELRFVPVPEGVCVLSLDVTNQRRTTAALARTESQLRHAQKMEAVGRLAGAVAHDFNNLLSVVLSYTSLILDRLHETDPLRADVVQIEKAGQRGTSLTRQLLAMSRNQVVAPRVLDLNESVRAMSKMIERLVGEDVDVQIREGAALGNVQADPGYIDQVLMNLVVNARDAMPQGGTLTIETVKVELDAEFAALHLDVTPGPYVMLIVSDTGSGMDKATRERIFEPFYTTKDKGRGTGLGLSTVFGIVRQMGGSIWVYSEPGHGATFKVYLPRTDEHHVAVAPVEVRSVHGTETILLVEDDELLRPVASTILRRNGYHVVEAEDGAQALEVASKLTRVDLLLTDVVMPGMSGRELADRLCALRPGLRVLFTSGYADDAIVHHRVLAPGIALLQKPITPDSLVRRVREVLDAKGSCPPTQSPGA